MASTLRDKAIAARSSRQLRADDSASASTHDDNAATRLLARAPLYATLAWQHTPAPAIARGRCLNSNVDPDECEDIHRVRSRRQRADVEDEIDPDECIEISHWPMQAARPPPFAHVIESSAQLHVNPSGAHQLTMRGSARAKTTRRSGANVIEIEQIPDDDDGQ